MASAPSLVVIEDAIYHLAPHAKEHQVKHVLGLIQAWAERPVIEKTCECSEKQRQRYTVRPDVNFKPYTWRGGKVA